MKTEIRKEQINIYVYTYFCRYCSFAVEGSQFTDKGKEDIKNHLTRHWFLQKILPGKYYYTDYVIKIEERDQKIFLCETCNFESRYSYDVVDDEINHLPTKQHTDGTVFYYCGTEEATKLFEDGKLREWYYWDEDFGYRPLSYKIAKLEEELVELKKIKNETA